MRCGCVAWWWWGTHTAAWCCVYVDEWMSGSLAVEWSSLGMRLAGQVESSRVRSALRLSCRSYNRRPISRPLNPSHPSSPQPTTRRKPIQCSHKLAIINHPIKEPTPQLEESSRRQKAIRARLMLLPNPCYAQLFGHVLKAAFEGFAGTHQVLDVVDCGEPDSEEREEVGFGGGEGRVGYDLREGAMGEVVAA